MTLLALFLLATLDGVLCGFRAAAGRCPLIRLRGYYVREMLRGTAAAQVASLLSLIALLITIRSSSHASALRGDLEGAAGRMLWIFLPYTAIVLFHLALRFVPSADVCSATSVFVLGPLTALRPLLMIVGVLYGISGSQLAETRLLGVVILALMLSLGYVLNALTERKQARELDHLV